MDLRQSPLICFQGPGCLFLCRPAFLPSVFGLRDLIYSTVTERQGVSLPPSNVFHVQLVCSRRFLLGNLPVQLQGLPPRFSSAQLAPNSDSSHSCLEALVSFVG